MLFTVRVYEDFDIDADSREEAIELLVEELTGENEHEKASLNMMVLHS